MQLGAEVTKICRKSTLREASYIPQPLLLRTVSDLRVPYALRPASNGLLPFWEKGSRSQSPSPALGEGFRVRAAKLGCTRLHNVWEIFLWQIQRSVHIFVTSAPSCINFGTPEKPEGVLPSWAGHLHYVVSG